MKRKAKILVLGNGRIGMAVAYYLKKKDLGNVAFLSREEDAKHCDLLIGALPGELGERCLAIALRYKKNLIDVSDVDPPFYIKEKTSIEKSGLTVIPGCGFSPGLINCIVGKECASGGDVAEIEIKAGSLSRKKYYFPFLWCFEDLVLGHRLASWQRIAARKRKFPPFAGYQEESYFGIEAESYYCASGFENLLGTHRIKNFIYRVIRPKGFMVFFNFLESQGYLCAEHMQTAKQIAESHRQDNFTFAEVNLAAKHKTVSWLMKSFSRKNEKLNSMQKITACVPAAVAHFLLGEKLSSQGLIFMEELGRQPSFFAGLLCSLRTEGIALTKRLTQEKLPC
jgi:saccharopine dehydrogenase-like NADP-dependent oxidoreductase